MSHAIGAHLLNKTATLTRTTHTSDGQGGDVERLSVHPTQASARVRYFAASGKDKELGDRDDELISHIGYVLPTIDLVRDDRLFVDDKRFDVIAAILPSEAHHIKLILKEVHGVYEIIQTKAGFDIHTKDDAGNETVLEVKP